MPRQETGQAREMTRTGECRRCGECCRLIGFRIDVAVPDIIGWVTARGGVVRGDMAIFEHPCPHLVDGNNCDVHGGEQPEVCKRFPEVYEQLLPGCGFGFDAKEATDGHNG